MVFKLYNGCPNDELQAHWDSEDDAHKTIKELGYLITYFPMEGGYFLAEQETYKSIGDLFSSKVSACNWLQTNLQSKENSA